MAQRVLKGSPNPKQLLFFQANTRHIAYGGARGGGKSWAMRRKFVLLALRYAGLRLLLLRRTLPELRENHIRPLQAELSGIAQYKETERVFLFPNGSRIKLGYCDCETDVLQYQGQEYDVVGMEEATHFTEYQRDFLTTCNRTVRLDFLPRMYYTANPGGVGHGWFRRLFINREYRNCERAEDYTFIPALVYDNPVLMKANPEYVTALSNLPEALRRAHLLGDWNVFAGQYFGEFRADVHVIKPFSIPAYWRRFRAMDYGLDTTCCIWFAIDTSGTCYAYRELHQANLSLSDAAENILKLSPSDEIISYTVASPDLWNRRQETGVSGTEILIRHGLCGLVKADSRRVEGWRNMREYLKLFTDAQGVLKARLILFENCIYSIRNIPLIQHDRLNGEDTADSPHEVTHAPEAIRYGLMSRPAPSPVQTDAKIGCYTKGELEDKKRIEKKKRTKAR